MEIVLLLLSLVSAAYSQAVPPPPPPDCPFVLTHGPGGSISEKGITPNATGMAAKMRPTTDFTMSNSKAFCEYSCTGVRGDDFEGCHAYSVSSGYIPIPVPDLQGCWLYTKIDPVKVVEGTELLYQRLCDDTTTSTTTTTTTTTTHPPPPSTSTTHPPPPSTSTTHPPPPSPTTPDPNLVCVWYLIVGVAHNGSGMALESYKVPSLVDEQICESYCVNGEYLSHWCDGYSYGTTQNLVTDECWIYSGIDVQEPTTVAGSNSLYLRECEVVTTTSTTTTTTHPPPPSPTPPDPNLVCVWYLIAGVAHNGEGMALEAYKVPSLVDAQICESYCVNGGYLSDWCDGYSYGGADECWIYSGIDVQNPTTVAGSNSLYLRECEVVTTTSTTTTTTTTAEPSGCAFGPLMKDVDGWPAQETYFVIIADLVDESECKKRCMDDANCHFYGFGGHNMQCYLYGPIDQVQLITDSKVELFGNICNDVRPPLLACGWVLSVPAMDPKTIAAEKTVKTFVTNEPWCQKLCHFGYVWGKGICNAYAWEPTMGGGNCLLMDAPGLDPATVDGGGGKSDLYMNVCAPA